jgi:hypothetical protein
VNPEAADAKKVFPNRNNQFKHCKNCGKSGHNSRTCTQ